MKPESNDTDNSDNTDNTDREPHGLTQIAGVFFDAGNTLVELDYQAIAKRIATEARVALSPDQVRRAELTARRKIDELYALERRSDRGMWWEYFGTILHELGVDDEAKSARLLETLHQDHRRSNLWRNPARGAKRILRGLRESGRIAAVISNSDGRIKDVLNNAGLLSHLDAVYDSALIGYEKPAPEVFHHALKAHKLSAESTIYVGDLENVDVLGATSIGMRPVLIDPSPRRRSGMTFKVVSDLEELIEWFDLLDPDDAS